MIRSLLLLLAASTLVAAPQAGAQESGGSGLGGFQGTAGAYGVKGFYFPEGSGLPLGSFVDVGVPDALATIATGPATFARSSVADPGDLVANPNALIGATNPDAPRTPEYPYRISARSSSGEPEASASPAPGLRSHVEATEGGSIAQSSAGRTEAPAVVTTGAVTTTADTSTDGSTVTVHSRTEVSSIEVLDILRIESVVIDVTATSDGETTTVDGGTTVGDAFVLDTPVVVDSDGVHPEEGEEEPTVPLVGEVVDGLLGGGGDGDDEQMGVLSTLEEAGLTVSVAAPREYEVEGAASLAATGLRIDFAFSDETVPLLSDLFDALPPIENPVPGVPGIEDAIALVEANNMFAIEFGGAYVDLGARPGFEFQPVTPPATPSSPVSTPSLDTGTASTPTGPVSTGSSSPTSQTAAPAPSSTTATPASTSPASLSAGIGAMALVALLLQPLIGDRIARAVGTILGADQPAFCPREGR